MICFAGKLFPIYLAKFSHSSAWNLCELPGVGPLHDELVLSVIKPTQLDSADARLP